MVQRTLLPQLLARAASFPVLVLTGPRQSGKTTLVRHAFPSHAYVSFEALDNRAWAMEDPRGFLAAHRDGAVLDEVQRVPELLSYLQGEVDDRPAPGRFVLTGSQNLNLLESVSQSLAGRAGLLTLLPFDGAELAQIRPGLDLWETVWRGGYPAIHARGLPAYEWLQSYITTYIERDVRQVLGVRDLLAFQTFLALCAGRTASLLNLSGLGSDAGVNYNTIKSWVSVLEASYVAFRVPVWHRNLNRRLIQAPKLHFVDSGVVCALLGIESSAQLRTHPLRGALFETWVASEVLKSFVHAGRTPRMSFLRDQTGHEVDLVIEDAGRALAVECKSGQTVADDAFKDLNFVANVARDRGIALEQILVYGGDVAQTRRGGRVLPWRAVGELLSPVGAPESPDQGAF